MDPAQIRQQILSIPLFAALPDPLDKHAVNILSRVCEIKHLRAGTTLFTQGEDVSDVGYVLLSGEVEVRKTNEPKLRVPAPELIGEMKQFSPIGQRTATVEACSQLEVLEFKWTDFHNDAGKRLDKNQLETLNKALQDYAWQHFTG